MGGTKAEINFRCRKCKSIFDNDVGTITFPTKANQRPTYENEIICPKCGVISSDKVLLTELGQTQLTEVYLDTSD